MSKTNPNPALRVCLITALILTIVAFLVLLALGCTVFKPRDPQVVLYPVGLAKVQLMDFITKNNVTSDLIMSIRNRNYAGFEFENATSQITYRGELVGWAPILVGNIPPRSTVNLTASATMLVEKLRVNSKAINDILDGSLNLTARVKMHGKMVAMKRLMKKRASVLVECHLSMFVKETPIRGDSWCWTKLKMWF